MECAARLLKETRVLMAAHQSGISSEHGLPQLGLRSKNVSLCRSEDRYGGGKQDALRSAAVLFNARPAASANRSMGSLCPREREEKRVSQQEKEGKDRSTKWTTV